MIDLTFGKMKSITICIQTILRSIDGLPTKNLHCRTSNFSVSSGSTLLMRFLAIVMGISSSLLTSCLWITARIFLPRRLAVEESRIDSSLETGESNTPTIYDPTRTGCIDGIKIIHLKTIYFSEKRESLTLNC